jgi:hypothetical protein
MKSIGRGFGLNLGKAKQPATRKWLCGNKVHLVGAIGFEPMTSTV